MFDLVTVKIGATQKEFYPKCHVRPQNHNVYRGDGEGVIHQSMNISISIDFNSTHVFSKYEYFFNIKRTLSGFQL